MKKLRAIAMAALAAGSIVSCVDNDYDLSKDIDLTVTVGGDLALPSSNTEAVTLNQILELDDHSTIKEIKANATVEESYGCAVGDYVLVQAGTSRPATFEIAPVAISGSGNSILTTLPTFTAVPGLPTVTQDIYIESNVVNLTSDNVSLQLVSLDKAEGTIHATIKVGLQSDNYNGTVKLQQGFRIELDKDLTVRLSNGEQDGVTVVDKHIIELTEDFGLSKNHEFNLGIEVVSAEFSEGRGIVSPGHFVFHSNVVFKGTVGVNGSELTPGVPTTISLQTVTGVQNGSMITSVTGVIDPDINVTPTEFTLNDIPDFLKDEDNDLDLYNPSILLTVTNNSPLTLQMRGQLKAYLDDETEAYETVSIGYDSDQQVVMPAHQVTTFLVCRHNEPGNPWFENKTVIEVPNLGNIMRVVPDRIEYTDVECWGLPYTTTLGLGQVYDYMADYSAVIPLAFDSNMKIHYTTDETGWDIEMDKYNFNEVNMLADVVNTLPLTMIPRVVALDYNGNEMTDVTASIEGSDGNQVNILAGNIGEPATTPIKIVLKSHGKSISNLDGVRLYFEAKNPKVGVNLNSGMTLHFDNVVLKLVGGVEVDLNNI